MTDQQPEPAETIRASQPEDTSGALLRLARQLEQRYGLRADGTCLRRLQGVLADRARLFNFIDTSAYLPLLERQQDEVDQVLASVLVGETSFFRTPAHFEALGGHVLPELDALLPPGAPVRLWSAGCATGEEAYSLALVCAQHLPGRRDFEVLGTDLSARALTLAGQACYGPRALRRMPPDLAARYLELVGAEQRVAASVQQRVRFEQRNLLNPPQGNDTHVVMCENVLIYFAPEAVERTLSNLAAALAPGGYLFLGHAERLPTRPIGLEAVSLGGVHAWRKALRLPAHLRAATSARHERGPRLGVRAQQRAAEQTLPTDAGGLLARGQALQPLETLRGEHPVDSGEAHLLAAQTFADLGQDQHALEHAQLAASLAPLSEGAHALLGTVLARVGAHEDAARAFERALYLAPEAPLVRFQFATLLRQVGQTGRAEREFASLARWLERLPADQPLGELSAGLLLRACRDQSARPTEGG